MERKLCLIVAATVAVIATGSTPIGAQQPGASRTLFQGARAVFSTIQGTAVNWTNEPMANTAVRLRDARLGRVVETVTTDRLGAFQFKALDPGSYVVEMMGPANDAVVAATPILNVGSGESMATLLKLPFRIPPLGGILGHTLPSAVAITSAAVAAGVLAKSVVGAPATDRALPGQ